MQSHNLEITKLRTCCYWVVPIFTIFCLLYVYHKSFSTTKERRNNKRLADTKTSSRSYSLWNLFLPFLKLILLELNKTKVHCIKSFNTVVDDFTFVGDCLLFIDHTTNTIFCSVAPFHLNIQLLQTAPV